MEKYYLVSGKALANVCFKESGKWYECNQKFGNEKISESQLKKYQRYLEIEKKDEINIEEEPKQTKATTTRKSPISTETL